MSLEKAHRWAASFDGVITRDEALACGLSLSAIDRLLRSGRWRRRHPAVFVVAGAPDTSRQRWHAALKWAGEGAVLSHATAGCIWKLERIEGDLIHVVVPRSRQPRGQPRVRVHRGMIGRGDAGLLDGLRVTSPARTLVDLAAVACDEALEIALDDALRRRLTTVARVRRVLDRAGPQGRKGAGVLHHLLDERSDGKPRHGSGFEVRLRRLLERHGLPQPEAQYRIRFDDGTYVEVDFAYPDRKLVIEADGYAWHSDVRSFRRDRRRLTKLAAHGHRVLFVTYDQLLHDERVVAREVEKAFLAA